MRALIGGIVHESSTLMVPVTGPTRLADFDVHVGAEMAREFRATNTIIGGYLAACRRHEVTAVPVLHARAEPGAAVDPAAYEFLERRFLALAGAAGPVDLVLLDLHGAGALVSGDSLDRALLRQVRGLLGPEVPIAVTLDLHANLPDLTGLVDVLVGFQEYPHTDMAERAERAAEMAVGQARGELRPVSRTLRLPMLLPPSTTTSAPAAELRDLARAAEAEPAVLACTVFHGFPYADTAQASASVVTVTDGAAGLADEVNKRVARRLWDSRERFLITPTTPAQAVTVVSSSGQPVVIGDGTDNPGSGAVGDSTYLLQALLDGGRRACFATVHDPATVAQAVAAGVGGELTVALGGRHGWASGPPVRGHAVVRAITDGQVVQRTMRQGKALDFGFCVRLSIGAVDVIVASRRRQVFDPEILLLHGVLPERYEVVAVKSVNHFRAGFAAVTDTIVVADAPGPLTRDIERLPRSGPTALLWPMDQDAVPARAGAIAAAGEADPRS